MTAPHFELWLGSYFRPSDDDTSSRDGRVMRHTAISAEAAIDLAAQGGAIIEAIRGGDTTRFAEWYDASYDSAWRFARRFVHDEATASDIVHDVFFAIWAGRATWSVRGSLQQYVLGAIRHRALNVKRHERTVDHHATRTEELDTGFLGMSAPTIAPDDAADEAQLRAILRRAVDELPERQRTALVLRWEHELSNLEIAGILGVGEAAVSRLLSRATAALRVVWDRLVG